MKYSDAREIGREEAVKELLSDDSRRVCSALVSLSLYGDDLSWVQNECLRYLEDDRVEVRAASATCLGHLARRYEGIDKNMVVDSLRRHLSDVEIVGRVEDALEDVFMFVK